MEYGMSETVTRNSYLLLLVFPNPGLPLHQEKLTGGNPLTGIGPSRTAWPHTCTTTQEEVWTETQWVVNSVS
jgi:hypothetical protein